MKKLTILLVVLLSVDFSKTQSENVASLANGAKCIQQSQQYDTWWHCDKALDGVSKVNSVDFSRGGWATRNQGVGASMTVQFAEPHTINRMRVMQRYWQITLAKYLQLQFQDGSTEEVFMNLFNYYFNLKATDSSGKIFNHKNVKFFMVMARS